MSMGICHRHLTNLGPFTHASSICIFYMNLLCCLCCLYNVQLEAEYARVVPQARKRMSARQTQQRIEARLEEIEKSTSSLRTRLRRKPQ